MKKRVRGRPKAGEVCYYCGRQASSIDHVIPKSMLRTIALSTEDITLENIKQRILTVYSCRECNSLLSNSYAETLVEKKRLLKQRLEKKYKKLLEMPDWSDCELDELGHNLQTYIKGAITHKELVKNRMRW